MSKDYLAVESWLSERAKQCAGKQALQIVKSQRKKKKKTQPVFSGKALELDSRFIEIQQGNNSFDIWIKLILQRDFDFNNGRLINLRCCFV